MLKITKGLKKKKKSKKSKHKEEELFKPEELEAYRREHQQQSEKAEPSGGADDEWKKFQALTADIDSVLRKTQGDLDRIKSTSFFQRIPTASEQKKAKEEQIQAEEAQIQEEKLDEARLAPPSTGVVELSETESEDEEVDDDIFDTSFVDAVASGEVKLAYIPESPTEDDFDGDDPFDTSIAERAILGPAFNKKGKKLVPLGSAVEVLTGRVELPTCAISRKPVPRRALQQQKDLLLGSFDTDDNGNNAEIVVAKTPLEQPRSLLDDDAIPFDAPIDLSGPSLHQITTVNPAEEKLVDPKRDYLTEFDILKDQEEDDEFALLAAESVAKKPTTVISDLRKETPTDLASAFTAHFEEIPSESFAAFGVNAFEEEVDDPFDTTFADNILPGKAELKIIEDEILNAETDTGRNVQEKFSDLIISQVSIHVTNPTGERESISSLDRVDESGLNSLQPIHRDLLGGSNTDLSKIGDEPIIPDQTVEESFSDYSDPFDTSIVDQVSAPGQAELKFLEKELLGEADLTRSLSDPDFNPRECEPELEKRYSRPDILDVNQPKSVKFTTPSVQPDLLGAGEDCGKYTKPLTPYYVRENSITDSQDPEEELAEDPFDTSFVAELAPGKAELKLLENEFAGPVPELKRKLSDPDFNPRASTPQVERVSVTRPKLPELPLKVIAKPDLLAVEEEVTAKVLTPAVETTSGIELTYSDPFDTSIACNILPGKAELRILEDELISTNTDIKRNLTDPDFNPRNALEEKAQPTRNIEDLFGNSEEQSFVKPLTPFAGEPVTFQVGEEENTDPFDTSIADNIAPGRAELKLLESELI